MYLDSFAYFLFATLMNKRNLPVVFGNKKRMQMNSNNTGIAIDKCLFCQRT